MNIDFLSDIERLSISLEELFSRFGYKKYMVSRFEKYSFYTENENFLEDSRVITFSGRSGTLLALKPDITMSIAKHCIKNPDDHHKIYYNESVFRIPRGQSEFSELRQIGIENIGDGDDYQIIEIINLAIKSLAKISSDFVLCLSNMVLIREAFRDLGLEVAQMNKIIEYMRQKNVHDLQKYIKEEKINDGGVFVRLITLDSDLVAGLAQLKEFYKNTRFESEIEQMDRIFTTLLTICEPAKLRLDYSHISNTLYYNGMVFTGYILGLAAPVLNGGRYDKLVAKMGLPNKSALGFAVLLNEVEKLYTSTEQIPKEVFYDEAASIIDTIQMANKLYDEGATFSVVQKRNKLKGDL